MISGYLIGDRKLIAQLQGVPGAIQRDVAKTVDMLGLRLIANVVSNQLSGQVLKRRTGRLAASIARGAKDTRSRFESTDTTATSVVGTNVSYGRTWEFGAHVPAYEIFPKNADALKFVMNGQTIFAKHVNMPARDIKARPYLAPALAAMKPLIIAELSAAATRAAAAAIKP